MSIFSSPSRSRSKTTYGTSGSPRGESYGSWGLDQLQGMMDPTAYGGNVPGAQGPNAAQDIQYSTLGGLQGAYAGPGGRWDTAYGINKGVAGMGPDAYNIGDRSGGPASGYIDPYMDEMLGHQKKLYGESLADMKNRIGAGAAGANAFGSTRHGAAEGVGGARAMDDYLRGATQIKSDAFTKGMGWQFEDQKLKSQLAMQANQDKLGFGQLNLSATDRMSNINPQLNLANAYGNYGLNQQNQQNMADTFNYGEFNRMQNWKPEMMNNYFAGVGNTPWETDTTTSTSETGSGGKSPFDKALGYAGTAAGMYLAYKGYTAGGGGTCIPKGTTIDMADGSKAPIEKIEAGDLVIGMDGKEVEVQQVHQYKQIPHAKFVTVTFDNGSKVNCSHDHMINNKRARNYMLNDKIGSRKVTNVVFYMGVKRSYDIITTTGGYRIEGIPVNTMIPEMAEKSLALANKLMKAA